MLVGDLILVMSGDPYFGPPIARQTLKAQFTVQVSNVAGTLSLDVKIEHRNRDDVSWSTVAVIAGITAPGQYQQTAASLKEMVRYRYEFTAGNPEDGVYIFAAQPQWLSD